MESGSQFLMTALAAVGILIGCMLIMAVGLLVRGVVMRGGCRGEPAADGKSGCATCGGDKNACKRESDQGGGNPSDAAST